MPNFVYFCEQPFFVDLYLLNGRDLAHEVFCINWGRFLASTSYLQTREITKDNISYAHSPGGYFQGDNNFILLIVQRNGIYEVVELCLVNRMIKCFKPNLKIMNLTKCEVAAPHHHTMTSLAFHSQCVGRTFLYLTFMMSK